MNIPESITFFIEKLVQILSSSVVFPFVGIWVSAYVIKMVASLLHVNGRN